MMQNAVKNNLRMPDAAILVFPYCNVSLDEVETPSEAYSYEETVTIPSHVRQITNTYLETVRDEERLNLFLTDPKVLSKFPKTLIISSGNEFLLDDCCKLAAFLKGNQVQVEKRHLIYYSKGEFEFPSFFDSDFNISIDYSLYFIQKLLTQNQKTL